ncbi:antitoxin Xre/MbcA/ParS toxin-binding domain-containing protein [Pseudomonas sp. BLCC-B112]|uniref:antitoxin Xre/MbcA/ParS toxin-binding domain-containing protein n=1 Tax=Pseudomonas sp. BLCC-B112 TaxID=3025319 RepID=UPI003FA70BDE
MNEFKVFGRCAFPPVDCWSASHRCYLARYEHVLSIAFKVFGSRKKALRWVGSSMSGLGDQTPCRLLFTPMGYTSIHDELMRLDHGIRA